MQDGAYSGDWPEAKRSRVGAVQRPRGIIFNDDTHELALDDAATPEGFLAHRIAPLAETQVGTISWSVLCGQFDAPAYDSKVQPIYGDAQGGPVAYWPNVTANVKALAEAGHCPLQLLVDFTHASKMETFASVRMNDVHDSFMGPNAMTVWKRTHPELLVDTRGMLPEFELYATAQDFSHEAVRRRKLEIVEEIAERYDVDGFELDYIRHPVLFSRRMRGEPCTADEVEIVNGLMREIREITDAAAARRERPMLIAARVPDTFSKALDNGMDVKAWMEGDLVDILIPGGGYAPFSLPVREFVQAARPHGVAVYPCINAGTAQKLSGGELLQCARGLAANWYRAGADGVYTWNLGTPFEYKAGHELEEIRAACYACLEEIGEAGTLAGKSKLFCADSAEGEVMAYYAHVSSPWPLPLSSKRGTLRTGVIGRVPLVVGDDLTAKPPARARLMVSIDDARWKDALVFRLNGHDLTGGEFVPQEERKGRLDFAVSAPLLRTGGNYIEVATRPGEIPDGVVKVTAITLGVSYS